MKRDRYQKFIRNLFFALLCVLLWLLPSKLYISPCIVLLTIAWALYPSIWIASDERELQWRNLCSSRLWIPMSLLIGYYLLYLISMAYTDNVAAGWFTMEKKLLFVFAPILLLTMPEELRTRKHFHWLLFSFIVGCCVTIIASLAYAVVCYNHTGDSAYFYYQLVSPFQHPSYLAMYIVFSLAAAIYLFVWHLEETGRAERIFLGIYSVPAMTYLVLLQSKSGFLSILLLLAFFLIYGICLRNKKLLVSILYLSILSAASFALIPAAGSRLQTSAEELSAGVESDVAEAGSTAMRMLVWKEALHITMENPIFGVGAGDTQECLNQRYKAAGMDKALRKELNAHSQVMQTAVAIGLVGVLVLAAIFIYPLFACRRSPLKPLWLFFILLVGLNILVESMWETIAGVSFFTLFYCLMAVYGKVKGER